MNEFQLMVTPVALGNGTPLFGGLPAKADLRLTHTRPFKPGIVLLRYGHA